MNRGLALWVFIAALAFAASPLVFGGFGGYPADLFPVPQEDPPIQPAGWAFSIWGLIYAWLIVGSGFGLWRRPADENWQPMRTPLALSLTVGVFWIPVASRAPGWATLMILLMLVLAVVAFLRAGRRDPVWQVWPVGLYAGWLTAASGVSVGIWLAGHGIMGAQSAAILWLLVIAATALAVQWLKPEASGYPAAVIWALLGVIAANLSPLNLAVVLIAALASAALAARAILSATRN